MEKKSARGFEKLERKETIGPGDICSCRKPSQFSRGLVFYFSLAEEIKNLDQHSGLSLVDQLSFDQFSYRVDQSFIRPVTNRPLKNTVLALNERQ